MQSQKSYFIINHIYVRHSRKISPITLRNLYLIRKSVFFNFLIILKVQFSKINDFKDKKLIKSLLQYNDFNTINYRNIFKIIFI